MSHVRATAPRRKSWNSRAAPFKRRKDEKLQSANAGWFAFQCAWGEKVLKEFLPCSDTQGQVGIHLTHNAVRRPPPNRPRSDSPGHWNGWVWFSLSFVRLVFARWGDGLANAGDKKMEALIFVLTARSGWDFSLWFSADSNQLIQLWSAFASHRRSMNVAGCKKKLL